MLEARGLHKIYQNGKDNIAALADVSLKVEPGEFLCVIGPSGAGKSTLLHILGGLEQPTEGQALLAGQDLYRLPEKTRAAIRNQRVGLVFQFYHLLPELSALENVTLPALIGKKPFAQSQQKAKELLQLVGLAARQNHRPTQLSGGEQQRAAIARALINDPEILLCDEPTGNLDSQRGEQIVGLLRALNQEQKKTLIIASHDQNIAKLAHRLINIKDGKLI